MPTRNDVFTEASISQLCEITGMVFRTIKGRLRNLEPVRQDRKTAFYDPKKALPLIYAPADPEARSLTRERARLAKEQADELELKNDELRKQLIPSEDADAASALIASVIERRMLAVPAEVAPLISAAESIQEAEAIIRDHITEALRDLADAEVRV